MTAEQFCYWLQGFAELTQDAPTPEQWKAIREHVATVFKKVTPPVQDIGALERLQQQQQQMAQYNMLAPLTQQKTPYGGGSIC